MKKQLKPGLTGLLAALVVALVASTASATPIGKMETGICLGGGVVVTATAIDWDGNGGGTGCVSTGLGTNVTYTGGGPLTSGVLGIIKDLTAGVLPVLDFMTFAGNPNLHFDLSAVGPGSANTNCAALSISQACSIAAGSPFILTLLSGDQTGVALSVFGVARDSGGVNSNWEGEFTTNISSLSPVQIQQLFLTNPSASLTSTHSGSFNVTAAPAIPEPASLLLLGTGLFGAAIRARKRSRA